MEKLFCCFVSISCCFRGSRGWGWKPRGPGCFPPSAHLTLAGFLFPSTPPSYFLPISEADFSNSLSNFSFSLPDFSFPFRISSILDFFFSFGFPPCPIFPPSFLYYLFFACLLSLLLFILPCLMSPLTCLASPPSPLFSFCVFPPLCLSSPVWF